MQPALSAKQVIHRLFGDVALAGWTITDVRASSGIRVTLSRSGPDPLREVVVVVRQTGQPGFFSSPRVSAMMIGTSTAGHAPLLDHLKRRMQSAVATFAEGELEAALDNAARRLLPVQATQVDARAHRPREVELRLNLACNQACFFCNCDGYAPNTIPVASQAIETARGLGGRGAESVVITGGEPTLNHALLDVARAARDGGVSRIMVQTNAVRLSEPGFASALRDAGVSTLFVSLHSSSAEVSDQITCSPGTHELTLRGIDEALASGLSVITNFVINALNVDEPPAYVAWQRERFGGKIAGRVFSFMAPVAAALNNLALIPRISDATPPLRAALDDCLRAKEWVRVAGVCGLPLCVLTGYEAISDESENPSGVPMAGDRVKPDGCQSCAHVAKCSGVWQEYVRIHGSDEFKPVAPR
jgi:hypothetical protein